MDSMTGRARGIVVGVDAHIDTGLVGERHGVLLLQQELRGIHQAPEDVFQRFGFSLISTTVKSA